MNFLFGFCFFRVSLFRNYIIYSFGSWENVRKCEQQVENVFSIVFSRTQPNTKKYFSKYFLKCHQTPENIFFSKEYFHLKIFYTWKTFYIGSVWIGLILLKLKTYCLNHCSKIIFKCVNSAVGPIFNEKIDKKWNLWVREQCTDVLFTKNWSKVAATVHVPYMNSSRKWGDNA